MARFGGHAFDSFSVPLVFEGRYFLVEHGDPSLVTVFLCVNGQPIFEVLRNAASAHDAVDITVKPSGILTVTDNTSGQFLYEIQQGSKTVVIFRKADGADCPAVITEEQIQIGGLAVDNRVFDGVLAGVVVDPEIGAGMLGSPLPPDVIDWLS